MNFTSESIKGEFKTAEGLSGDADASEPRLWWCAWKHTLFAEVCQNGMKICESMSNLEAAFSETGEDGGNKSGIMVTIQQMAAEKNITEDLNKTIDMIKHVVNE